MITKRQAETHRFTGVKIHGRTRAFTLENTLSRHFHGIFTVISRYFGVDRVHTKTAMAHCKAQKNRLPPRQTGEVQRTFKKQAWISRAYVYIYMYIYIYISDLLFCVNEHADPCVYYIYIYIYKRTCSVHVAFVLHIYISVRLVEPSTRGPNANSQFGLVVASLLIHSPAHTRYMSSFETSRMRDFTWLALGSPK